MGSLFVMAYTFRGIEISLHRNADGAFELVYSEIEMS